jgi:beta-glucosidase
MATINLGTATPNEGDMRQVDLKQATIQIQPVTLDTPSLSPATTPEQNSPSEEVMAGNKVFSTARPADKARELAAQLTLEEQVCTLLSSAEGAWTPTRGSHAARVNRKMNGTRVFP